MALLHCAPSVFETVMMHDNPQRRKNKDGLNVMMYCLQAICTSMLRRIRRVSWLCDKHKFGDFCLWERYSSEVNAIDVASTSSAALCCERGKKNGYTALGVAAYITLLVCRRKFDKTKHQMQVQQDQLQHHGFANKFASETREIQKKEASICFLEKHLVSYFWDRMFREYKIAFTMSIHPKLGPNSPTRVRTTR